MENLSIETEFITLGQLLKMTDAISSGGMAKWYLSENDVFVNGEIERRRGKKIKHSDVVNIPGVGRFQIIGQENEEQHAH